MRIALPFSFRLQMSPRPDPWQDYRRRRWRVLWAALAGLAVFACSLLLCRHLHSAKPAFVGLVVWIGLTVRASVRLSNFPCPKCGKPFTCNDDLRDGGARKCLHCQHPKWADPA
jgi:predicted RNA-binding Zn-ribbon protein involved in translation (DUF1610 family)